MAEYQKEKNFMGAVFANETFCGKSVNERQINQCGTEYKRIKILNYISRVKS